MLLNDFKKRIKIILGSLDNVKCGPYDIFDETVIEFLNQISKEILKNRKFKKYTDVVSFGFWCRLSNIKKIIENYKFYKNRLGRGTVLHITPSNVPTNFAYSLVFGLLAGNHNLVRLPRKNFPQVKIICEILIKLFKKKKFKSIINRITLIKYENSDEISLQLSKFADARVIWGGDETVKKFKSFETHPRCIDLTFANRFSASLINLEELDKLNNNKIKELTNKFYNDTYTMDQFGCSSPTIVFWHGRKKNSKIKFWEELQKIVNKNYEYDLSSINKKFSNLTSLLLKEKKKFNLNFDNFNLIRFQNHNDNFQDFTNVNFGSFYEVDLKNLNSINKFASKKLQTITYYGYNFDDLKKIILKNKIKGIDRLVPIGKAFDLTPEWDGIDILLTLSRTISS